MKKALFLIFFLIALAIPSVQAIEFGAGTLFQSRGAGGYLVFSDDFNATSVSWSGNIIIFEDFINDDGSFGDLGFDLPNGINVTVTSVYPNEIYQTMTHWGDVSYIVYAPDHDIPLDVSGVSTFSYSDATSQILIPITDNGTVLITWASWYVENDTYSQPVQTIPDLINQYLPLGDLLGFVIAPYTLTMGMMFFPILLIAFSIPIYQRLGFMTTGILWILFWATFVIVLPPQGINLVWIMLWISVGGVLVYLFFGRRRQYG